MMRSWFGVPAATLAALKVTGVVDWPWWVLGAIWAGFVCLTAVSFVLGVAWVMSLIR